MKQYLSIVLLTLLVVVVTPLFGQTEDDENDGRRHNGLVSEYSNSLDDIRTTESSFSLSSGIIEEEIIDECKVYPNPVFEQLSYRIQSSGGFEGTVIIYDALGNIIEEDIIYIAEGSNTLNFDVSNSESGMYIIVIINDNGLFCSDRFFKL